MIQRVVLASRNLHKVFEMARLAPDIEWASLPAELGDPPETGTTFSENALQKSRFAFEATGEPSVADDSGLEVDALDGRPGVYSRRYSEEATDTANNLKLLTELAGVLNRRARYRCVLAFVGQGFERVVAGACEGTIGLVARGTGGFGYDPLFWPDDRPGGTMADLSAEEKAAISHRGVAMRALLPILTSAQLPAAKGLRRPQ